MTQTMPHHGKMETGGIAASELLKNARLVARKIGEVALRPLKWIDRWVSARVDAAPRGESGWYLHTGEGRAIASGAEATEGVDISGALRGPEFALAIEAVRRTKTPEGSDYGELLDATFTTYHDLRQRAAAGEQIPPTQPHPEP